MDMTEAPRIFYLLYEGYAGFELVFVANQFMDRKTATVGFGKEPTRSMENLWTVVDLDILDLDPEQVDLLVIPGGVPSKLINDERMRERVDSLVSKMRRIHERGGKLAAICGGPEFLAYAGLLDGRRCTHNVEPPSKWFSKAVFTGEYVTVDGNIVTAQGKAFPEFAVQMGREMGVYKTEQQAQDDLDWLRDRKPRS